MFYWVKYFSISIMRFKITSALALHRFIKISLRRMFSRSVSGRPLRKPNNFCISPLASDRLFNASISLSVKRCLGYLPSNRLRAYALVVNPQRAAYSAISLWSCGVSLTIRRLVHFGVSISQQRVTFLQTVYKFIFRHDAMVYCSFHSDGLQPPVLSPPPTWLLLHAPSQARLSSQRR